MALAVLGAGSWGTALAVLFARHGITVRLWGHDRAAVADLQRDRENRRFLPGIPFPPGLAATASLAETLQDADDILIVVPSHAFREVVAGVAAIRADAATLSWATKGLDAHSSRPLHEVAAEHLPRAQLAVLSGPTFAAEVARGAPTAITVAGTDRDYADRIATRLHGGTLRVYTSDDLIGVEIGGATKNVMAIAAGISDGLGFGANARAALVTRGLAEITRLGLALGGLPETFMGLAGLGDLILTCTDDQSRNRRMGLALARGMSIDRAREDIGQEVEGIATTREVFRLAEREGIDMPITEQVYRILYEGLDPRRAVRNLLHRHQRPESDPADESRSS